MQHVHSSALLNADHDFLNFWIVELSCYCASVIIPYKPSRDWHKILPFDFFFFSLSQTAANPCLNYPRRLDWHNCQLSLNSDKKGRTRFPLQICRRIAFHLIKQYSSSTIFCIVSVSQPRKKTNPVQPSVVKCSTRRARKHKRKLGSSWIRSKEAECISWPKDNLIQPSHLELEEELARAITYGNMIIETTSCF